MSNKINMTIDEKVLFDILAKSVKWRSPSMYHIDPLKEEKARKVSEKLFQVSTPSSRMDYHSLKPLPKEHRISSKDSLIFYNQQLGRAWRKIMHHEKITIEITNNGYYVRVGCQSFVFTDASEMADAIAFYRENSKEAEKKYCNTGEK